MKKKTRLKKGISQRMLSLLVLTAVVMLITAKMYQSFKVDLIFKDIRQLEQEKKNLQHETSQLQAEVDRLSNIDRIRDLVKKEHHMVVDKDRRQVIVIEGFDKLENIMHRFAERENASERLNMAGVR